MPTNDRDGHFEVAILNELLRLEEDGFAQRLLESNVFVSPRSLSLYDTVVRLAAVSREHGAALSRLILDMGGTPAPRPADARSADLHFQELEKALPRLIDWQKTVVTKYELAVRRLAGHPHSSTLVPRLLEEQRKALARLEEHAASRTVTAGESSVDHP